MADLKAYEVTDRRNWDGATIVFAETAGKAKALALNTDTCEGLEFTDISARRAPKLDAAYRGRWEMDWWDNEDRIAMVRDANFVCDLSDVSYEELYCEDCPANQWCREYAKREAEDEP